MQSLRETFRSHSGSFRTVRKVKQRAALNGFNGLDVDVVIGWKARSCVPSFCQETALQRKCPVDVKSIIPDYSRGQVPSVHFAEGRQRDSPCLPNVTSTHPRTRLRLTEPSTTVSRSEDAPIGCHHQHNGVLLPGQGPPTNPRRVPKLVHSPCSRCPADPQIADCPSASTTSGLSDNTTASHTYSATTANRWHCQRRGHNTRMPAHAWQLPLEHGKARPRPVSAHELDANVSQICFRCPDPHHCSSFCRRLTASRA